MLAIAKATTATVPCTSRKSQPHQPSTRERKKDKQARKEHLIRLLAEARSWGPIGLALLGGRHLQICGLAGEVSGHKRRQQEHETETDQTFRWSDRIRDPAESGHAHHRCRHRTSAERREHSTHQVRWSDFLQQGPHHWIENCSSRTPRGSQMPPRSAGSQPAEGAKGKPAHGRSPDEDLHAAPYIILLSQGQPRGRLSIPAPRADQSQPS